MLYKTQCADEQRTYSTAKTATDQQHVVMNNSFYSQQLLQLLYNYFKV